MNNTIYELKFMDKDQKIWNSRELFDKFCSEYNDSSMAEKQEILEFLINDGLKVNEILFGILSQAKELNKNIQPIELLMGVGELLEFIIKNKN